MIGIIIKIVIAVAVLSAIGLLLWLRQRDGQIIKLRWVIQGTGWILCPCCEGDEAHELTNPKRPLREMRRMNGGKHYASANWVNCHPCGGRGYVMSGPNYDYSGYTRGSCVTRR
jgi:hypothetical protein